MRDEDRSLAATISFYRGRGRAKGVTFLDVAICTVALHEVVLQTLYRLMSVALQAYDDLRWS